MGFFSTWLQKLHETFIETQYWKLMLEGFGNTIVITLGALLIGVLIGTLIAVIKYCAEGTKALKPLAWICDLYVTVIRGVPVVVLLMIVMFAITAYVLKYTSFGRKIYAIGGNKNASYLSGINIRRVQMGGFVYCSVAGALGGILLASQVGVALPTCGIGSDMDVIASVVLGGVSLSGGCGKVSGTLLGALILQTISNGMTLLSVQSYWQMVIKGIVLILAVLIDVMRSKKR